MAMAATVWHVCEGPSPTCWPLLPLSLYSLQYPPVAWRGSCVCVSVGSELALPFNEDKCCGSDRREEYSKQALTLPNDDTHETYWFVILTFWEDLPHLGW